VVIAVSGRCAGERVPKSFGGEGEGRGRNKGRQARAGGGWWQGFVGLRCLAGRLADLEDLGSGRGGGKLFSGRVGWARERYLPEGPREGVGGYSSRAILFFAGRHHPPTQPPAHLITSALASAVGTALLAACKMHLPLSHGRARTAGPPRAAGPGGADFFGESATPAQVALVLGLSGSRLSSAAARATGWTRHSRRAGGRCD
jgi:hypothetical protein